MPAPHVHFDNHAGVGNTVYQQSTSLCEPKGVISHPHDFYSRHSYAKTFRCTTDRDKVTCPKCKALMPPTWKTLLYAALEAKYDLPKGSITSIDQYADPCPHCGVEYQTHLNYREGKSLKCKTLTQSLNSILEELP